RPPHRGAHAPAALEQRPYHVAAEEARAAENRDQPLVGERERHRQNLSRVVAALLALRRGDGKLQPTGTNRPSWSRVRTPLRMPKRKPSSCSRPSASASAIHGKVRRLSSDSFTTSSSQ